jgi:hypothetical protein
MTNTLRSVASVTRTTSTVLLCLGLLAVPLTACSGSSSSDGNKGSAGEGSGTAGATAGDGDTAGATSSSAGATGSSAGATDSSAGATGSSAGAPGSAGAGTGTGTMDAVTECTALYAAECKQAFKCLTADDLAQANIGATEADCRTSLTDCSPDAAACNPGETYHGDQAEACVNALGALSCDDFIAFLGSETPPDACNTVCQ